MARVPVTGEKTNNNDKVSKRNEKKKKTARMSTKVGIKNRRKADIPEGSSSSSAQARVVDAGVQKSVVAKKKGLQDNGNGVKKAKIR